MLLHSIASIVVSLLPSLAIGQAPPVTGKAVRALALFDANMRAVVETQDVPGAALALGKGGRLLYSRGFGYADTEKNQPVQPESLFRIASISKPLTAVAILQLVESNKLKLDDKILDVLNLEAPKTGFDERWRQITILNLLHHTGGWETEKTFEPMFYAPPIVEELKAKLPLDQQTIIRYMLRKPLQFDPGSHHAYSNFGYCLLGRVIEKVSGTTYEAYVQQHVLAPLGIKRMRLGKTLLKDRAKDEVHYYTANNKKGPAVVGPELGVPVLEPYGTFYLEAMDSHGAWLASSEDIVRFGMAFDNPRRCKILTEKGIVTMLSRPPGQPGLDSSGNPAESYYACGWNVRPSGKGVTFWHAGSMPGTSTILVCRQDGWRWAALFNTRDTAEKGKTPVDLVDAILHRSADAVRLR
jgi:CubicO group peptidase (beta-lactamase class C family)